MNGCRGYSSFFARTLADFFAALLLWPVLRKNGNASEREREMQARAGALNLLSLY